MNGQKLKEPLLSVNLGKEPNKGCLCGIDIGREVNGTTHVFVYYYIKTEGTGTPIGIYLNRYDLLNNKLVNPKLVLYVPKVGQSIHNGGGIKIGPDNNMYVPIGELDGHRTKGSKYSQWTGAGRNEFYTQNNCKMEKSAPGNPLGNTDPLNKYYAYGIRNSFENDFDPVTKILWDTENGPAWGDEINLVQPGFNSGWAQVQGVWHTGKGWNIYRHSAAI